MINKNKAARHQCQIMLSKNVCHEKIHAAQNRPNQNNIQDDSSATITNSVPYRISVRQYRMFLLTCINELRISSQDQTVL